MIEVVKAQPDGLTFGSPRTPERSHAVPTPVPVPNSAIVPLRVAASVASSRPVSLRQNDT